MSNINDSLQRLLENVEKEGFASFFLSYSDPDSWQRARGVLPSTLTAAWRRLLDAYDELAKAVEATEATENLAGHNAYEEIRSLYVSQPASVLRRFLLGETTIKLRLPAGVTEDDLRASLCNHAAAKLSVRNLGAYMAAIEVVS